MTNIEYYKTKEIAEYGYRSYPDWKMDFENWLSCEHVNEMPSLFGNKGYPYYIATYEEAKRWYEKEQQNKESN